METLEKPKKTLVIITNSVTGGGAENAMQLLHNSLLKEFESHLIALNDGEIKGHNIPNSHVLSRRWGSGLLGTVRTYLSFQKILRALKPNFVIVNCELPELFIALTPLHKGKIICVEHTTRPWLNRRLLGLLVRTFLRLRKVEWVTVSQNKLKVWCAKFPAMYIPNPVNSPTLGNPIRKPSALLIGRLINGKRPHWAISAAGKAQIRLEVFGDGPMLRDLKKLSESEKYMVEFHGYLENCWNLISHTDILLMPSSFEGDGIVVVEAILGGLSILAADNSDLRRFGLPEDCYFSDEEELTEKLIKFKGDSNTNYLPDVSTIEKYRQERSLDSICATWIDYICSKT